MEEVVAVREGDSAFIADSRYFPLVIVTWFGPMTEPIMVRYFEWQDQVLHRAIAEKTKFAFVADTTRSSRPTPKVRKLIVQLSDAGPKEAGQYALPTYTAIESALVRGAITAMQWVVAIDWRIVPVASVRVALQRAIAALATERITVSSEIAPERYVSPEMPRTSSSGTAGR